MQWTWRLNPAEGAEPLRVDLEVPSFAARADAESWLGEHWRGLHEQGALTASLIREGERIGWPLPLREGQ